MPSADGFALADAALRVARARERAASEVRCWPHHFDVATLIDEGAGRSIIVGYSPGDAGIAEPNFYLTPWPTPASRVGTVDGWTRSCAGR